MKTFFKIAKKILNISFWIIIVLLTISIIISVIAHFNGTSPSIFGYSIYRVSSGSMEPELSVGDVILGKQVDNPEQIKVGDVITFSGSGQMTGELITHEVIVAPMYENGNYVLQTKGIANQIPDNPITFDKVVSIMVCELPFLNILYNFFFTPLGLIVAILLIILAFSGEFINIYRLTKKENPKDNINEETINKAIKKYKEEKDSKAEKTQDNNET